MVLPWAMKSSTSLCDCMVISMDSVDVMQPLCAYISFELLSLGSKMLTCKLDSR